MSNKKINFSFSIDTLMKSLAKAMGCEPKARQIALHLGISEQDFSNRKKRDTLIDPVVRWALANNVDVNWLFTGKEPTSQKPQPPQLVIETVKKYSHRVHDAIEQGLYIPVRLLKDSVAAGAPAMVDENHVEGWALIYADRQWMPNDPEKYTCVKVKGRSMYPVLDDGDIVAIDHAEKNPKYLDGKMVAFRVNGGVTIKWLKYRPKEKTVVGVPENHEELDHVVILVGPEIDEGIVGLVRWWWAKR